MADARALSRRSGKDRRAAGPAFAVRQSICREPIDAADEVVAARA